MHKQIVSIFFYLLLLMNLQAGCQEKSSAPIEAQETSENLNRALFIFLDDSEYERSKIGAITLDFLNAFLTQAGPIIVSAAILKNIVSWKIPTETDPQKLYNTVFVQTTNSQENQENKNIILSTVFSKSSVHDSFQPWIIKEIHQSLYLLMPKNYLNSFDITESSAQSTATNSTITSAEQELGLKINHMRTIFDINEIKPSKGSNQRNTFFTRAFGLSNMWSPETKFIQSLWNNNTKNSDIFVTKNDYYNLKNKKIPCWSILLNGHGSLGTELASLSLTDFKELLSFLGTNINTKLLYYSTCYGAGTNSNLIYKDAEQAIEKTYSYTIITDSLIESTISSTSHMDIELKNETLSVVTNPFHKLFTLETTKDVPDYRNLMNYELKTKVSQQTITDATPQIKYPGLPWFSLVNSDPVVSIGSILAKNRTAPLNVATFFPKKLNLMTDSSGKTQVTTQEREIFGILLYATKLPFEIIVNTKNNARTPPEIISMIPGDVTHHIKMISSPIYSLDALLESFTQIFKIGFHKTFIIDQLQAPDGVIKNVVIQLIPGQHAITYWTDQNSRIFKKTSQIGLRPWSVGPKLTNLKSYTLGHETYASMIDGLVYRSILKSVKSVDNYSLFKNIVYQTPISIRQDLGMWLRKSKRYAANFYAKNLAPAASKLATWFKLKEIDPNQITLSK